MDADTNLPLRKKREKSAPVEETVAFYRQIPSTDARTDREAFAASAERSMSALIVCKYNGHRTIVDQKRKLSW